MFGIEFYPTPPLLAARMLSKVSWPHVKSVLDPSAGKGDLLEAVKSRHRYSTPILYAIEIDPNLQAVLKQDYRLLDSDFLEYAGQDQFDLILMNPPFSDGHRHLIKAIDLMFSGQIVCLLNAETVRNPSSNSRKALVQKLNELGAEIQYIQNAFSTAERKTDVEVALIYINKTRKVEESLFSGAEDQAGEYDPEDLKQDTSIALKNDISALVARYDHVKQVGIQTVTDFYRHNNHIGKYLSLTTDKSTSGDLTGRMKLVVNDFLADIRKDYWHKAMDLPSITGKLTQEKRQQFAHELERQSSMEFTLKNVLAFAQNLSANYIDTLKDAVVNLFDQMTRDHSWYPETKRNILHFSGWKTNNAFKVNRKVILPNFRFIDDILGRWRVRWEVKERLNDIDKVMSYFDGGRHDCLSIADALEQAFNDGETKNIESTYFVISVYKKGTIHLTFRDDNILRRFNITACQGKNWLPHDYGRKQYSDMKRDEQAAVDGFEGKKNYRTESGSLLRIEMLNN